MLTTNQVKVKEGKARGLKYLITGKTKPRILPPPDPNAVSDGVNVRETRKVSGPMLTTANYEERKRALKREGAMAAKRALKSRPDIEALSDLPELEGVEYVTVEGESRPVIPASGKPSSVKLKEI